MRISPNWQKYGPFATIAAGRARSLLAPGDRPRGSRRGAWHARLWRAGCRGWTRHGAYMVADGREVGINRARLDLDEIPRNPFWCPRLQGRRRDWAEYLDWLRKDDHIPVGAIIEVVAQGVPPGLGAPVYGKLDTDLAAALHVDQRRERAWRSARGWAAAALTGARQCGRDRHGADTGPNYASNHAGGILGGHLHRAGYRASVSR